MFINMLENLSSILKKAERHAEKRKIDKDIFINARLIADMWPLTRQIQIGTDMIRLGIGRLANIKAPSYKDNERTFTDLQRRINKTVTFLKKINPKKMEGSENIEIKFSIGSNEFKFKSGKDYLTKWMIPHFFFHVTTAYDILRSNGVNLGKRDYIKF
jgi:hypothetical protein